MFFEHGDGLIPKLCPTLVTPWTVACQGPLSMGFSGKNTGVDPPSSEDLPNPGIEPGSPALLADSLPAELKGKPFFFFSIYHHIHLQI